MTTEKPQIVAFFDEPTFTVSYVVGDPETSQAVVIDPVLDFNPNTGKADRRSADAILAAAKERGWTIALVLETHGHADHITAAPYIKAKTAAKVGIGEHIRQVQEVFRPVFEIEDLKPDAADFDLLLKDGEQIAVGNMTIDVLHTPGHTPADVSYRIGDAVFVGDTMFMPDYGTARADFPGGDARQLYHSIRKLLSLPRETRLFMCHDYKAPGRDEYAWETTVADERDKSVHIHDGVSEDEFVAMRNARDATLDAPRLLLPSIQVNVRAGRFPPPDANGVRYLKLPLKLDPALGA
ncbi:MAG TPA: MBL fold metallo-hydrolase [Croceibacterium sp.]|jgi:glyoxylase-like metal-dependent hydrolase (beta-lactamase superfamily II)